MSLLAYNLTASPITLTGITPTIIVPASAAAPLPGSSINVTSELRGLSGAAYTALQTQSLGAVQYIWSTGVAEYSTPGLVVQDSTKARVINTATTIYVATTGSDSTGTGSASTPFATIQNALDSLKGYDLQSNVTISVGAGTFAGFTLALTGNVKAGVANVLKIKGTIAQQDTGTFSAQSKTGTLLTFTDSSKAWTVNQFADMFLEMTISSGVSYYPIVSNTATQLVVVSAITTFSPLNYRIVSLSTQVGPTGPNQTGSTSASTAIEVHNQCGYDNLTVCEHLNVAAATGSGRGVNCSSSMAGATFKYCKLLGTGLVFNYTGGLAIQGCVISGSASGSGISMAATGRRSRSLTLSESYFRTSIVGVILACPDQHSISACYFSGMLTAGIKISDGAKLAVNAQIDNCPVGIQVSTRAMALQSVAGAVLHGTGNTIAIICTTGGMLQLNPVSTITGTTEISVDGVTSTIAAMRALTPKVFPAAANPYGSYVYE